MLTEEELSSVLSRSHIEPKEAEFCRRVWKIDHEIYMQRLQAIGFCNMGLVLDAGCGFGQWTIALAKLNQSIFAVDVSPERVKATEAIMRMKNVSNVKLMPSSVELLPFPDNQFDALFAYQVIYYTDYRKTLAEFRRVLKPGAPLYLSAPGLGWYLWCLIDAPNASENYNPRQVAIDALNNTLQFMIHKKIRQNTQIVTPSSLIQNELLGLGFENLRVAGEGMLQIDSNAKGKSFYSAEMYSKENVYEILGYKQGK